MRNLSNQTIQLVGAMFIGLVIVMLIGILAILEQPVPDTLDTLGKIIFGAVLGSTAVNGVRAATK